MKENYEKIKKEVFYLSLLIERLQKDLILKIKNEDTF